ncbi:uncharacterized protein JCM6883_004450 [Sporobolomyces salmoneus]|uniref:uncharacterized protein n=1 Tax=Sporobolomyces salmoneus TaxID=183962 RepID=UPI003173FC54
MSTPPLAASEIAWIFHGTILTPELDRTLSILPSHVLVVDKRGSIAHLEEEREETSKEYLRLVQHGHGEIGRGRFVQIGEDGWLVPGFVDTHIHAPQYVNAGMALDRPLMEWLEHYTFKAESRIDSDPQGYGKKVYERLVERLRENGTTSASVFGTIRVEANMVLARTFQGAGIRGQIGKVSMDQNSPSFYVETTRTSLDETRRFISLINDLNSSIPEHLRLVEPVVTPRFVPTCTRELLVGLKEIAKSEGVRVQSHLAESKAEVELCKEMLNGQTDVEYFNELGLLGPCSLMAHCTHSLPSDLLLFSLTSTSISHCPLSNVYFSPERQLPLREAWNEGVKVGLGSDISGGYRVGLDEGMRWSVGVSKLREGARISSSSADEKGESLAISWKESLYLATLGGAQALGLDETRRVGQLRVGWAFDAQLIRIGGKGSRVDWFGELGWEEKVEKWWCNGNEADRKGVWVQGRKVYENETE